VFRFSIVGVNFLFWSYLLDSLHAAASFWVKIEKNIHASCRVV